MITREVYNQRPREHAFTYAYAQPDEYHFCMDSIILPYFVSRQLPEIPAEAQRFHALDLCAGCGVVGLELSYYRSWIENFDFLEIQGIFRPFFERNLRITSNQARNYRFIESHLSVLTTESFRERYDLIVANPPYFRRGEGVPPSGEIRERARFFCDASPPDLLRGIGNALKPGGGAFVLMRPGETHGHHDGEDLSKELSPECSWQIRAEIRGTNVVEIRKRPVV